MSTLGINAALAAQKRVPTDDEAKAILKYLRSHPEDENGILKMMERYNCTKTSVVKIIMVEEF